LGENHRLRSRPLQESATLSKGMPTSKRPERLGDLFKSGSNFPQGLPNPARMGAGIDLGVWSYLQDQSESIAAVSAALQRPPVTTDAAGYEIDIVGGAVYAT